MPDEFLPDEFSLTRSSYSRPVLAANLSFPMSIRVFLAILATFAFSACSNRSIYDGIQTSNRIECGKMPPSEYDECIERVNQPYDEYVRQLPETSKP